MHVSPIVVVCPSNKGWVARPPYLTDRQLDIPAVMTAGGMSIHLGCR